MCARAFRPFDQHYRVGGGIESQLFYLGHVLDSVQIDVPNWRVELLIRLDDREARAGNVALVAERGDEAARERRLADPERTGKRDHIPHPGGLRQGRARSGRCRFTRQNHRDPRGIVRVTVVPLPLSDSSSTVPPCASMNCCVSGRPSPSAASPRTPASATRSNRLNTRGRSCASMPEPLSRTRITAWFLSPSATREMRPLRSV